MESYIVTWQHVNGSSPVVAIRLIFWPPTSLGPRLLEGVVLNGLSESHPFSADAHTERLKCQKIEGGYGPRARNPLKGWSGRPDSNRRRPAWEAGILPLNYGRGSAALIIPPTREATAL